MIVGSYGLFWERSLVDWDSRKWQLLGRRNLRRPALQVVDFRKARGVYVLYNGIGVWYVGLAIRQGIGKRLHDHLSDDHGESWTRFSWFSFDVPAVDPGPDGVRDIDTSLNKVDVEAPVLIRDLEALLQRVMQPFGNRSLTNFASGDEWTQVATAQPAVWTMEDLAPRLR